MAVAIAWVGICTVPAFAQAPVEPPADSVVATGAFIPRGPPNGTPRRVDAGGACVIDLRQDYDVEGTLSGTFEVDFRIIVHGACGSPAGTFDEEWIAVGRFAGTVVTDEVSSGFTYVAAVGDAGEIAGTIKFGPELAGEVVVSGRFSDGRLAYAGWVGT